MYIRDAQGRLRWLPPQDFTKQLAMQQQSMRQNEIQDEWMRFNAPPPQDAIHFDYDYDYDVEPPPPPPAAAVALPPISTQRHPHLTRQLPQHQPQQSQAMPTGPVPHYNPYHGNQPYYQHQTSNLPPGFQYQQELPQRHHNQVQGHRQFQGGSSRHPPIPQVIQPTMLSPRESIGVSPSQGSQMKHNNAELTNKKETTGGNEGTRHQYDDDDEQEDQHLENVGCMNTLFGGTMATPRNRKAGTNTMGMTSNHMDSTTAEVDFNIKLPDHYKDFMKNDNSPHLMRTMKDGKGQGENEESHDDRSKNLVNDNSINPDPQSERPEVVTSMNSNNPMAAFQCHGGGRNVLDDNTKTTVLDPSIFQCHGVRGPPKKFDYSCTPRVGQITNNIQRQGKGNTGHYNRNLPDLDEMSFHDSFDEKSYVLDTNMFGPPPTLRQKVGRVQPKKNKKIKAKPGKPHSSFLPSSLGQSSVDGTSSRPQSQSKKVAHTKKKDRRLRQEVDKTRHIGNTISVPIDPTTIQKNSGNDIQLQTKSSEEQKQLQESVAEICRQRMAELMLDGYPSFDTTKHSPPNSIKNIDKVDEKRDKLSTSFTESCGSKKETKASEILSSSSSSDDSFSSAIDGENIQHHANTAATIISNTKSDTVVKLGRKYVVDDQLYHTIQPIKTSRGVVTTNDTPFDEC